MTTEHACEPNTLICAVCKRRYCHGCRMRHLHAFGGTAPKTYTPTERNAIRRFLREADADPTVSSTVGIVGLLARLEETK